MKKTLIIACALLSVLSLTAYNHYNNDKTENNLCTSPTEEVISTINPDFVYEVSTRYIANITLKDLHNARSVKEIFPAKATIDIEDFMDTKITLIQGEKETSISWLKGDLNPAQLDLIRKSDHSDNIFVSAYYNGKNQFSGAIERRQLTYYISITPEHQAQYNLGLETLLKELSDATIVERKAINMDKIRPGRIHFTIDQTGKIKDINLASSSGYEEMDEALTRQLTNLQLDWTPASNAKGQVVEQELILFFGSMGC